VAGGTAGRQCGDLKTGEYDVDLMVRLKGRITKGPPGESASTVTPEVETLIGHLIGQLEEREQDKLLDHLHELYEKHGQQMPKVEQAILDRVNRMLHRLRRVVSTPRAGATSGSIDILPLDASDAPAHRPTRAAGSRGRNKKGAA